jgi:spermidine synthase
MLRSRLTPGGFAVTWAPTPRIHDTFRTVFTHVLSFNDILIGSDRPIRFDADEIRARLRQPAVQAYYWRAGIDITRLLAPYLETSPQIFDAALALGRTDLNEDLFPRDEFSVPRSGR